MRIGILTGGGDCPGLNAVIRAVGGVHSTGATRWSPSATAGAASSTGSSRRSSARTSPASSRAAGRSSAPRGRTRTKIEGGVEAVLAQHRGERPRRAGRDRRRGHAGRRCDASTASTGFPVVGVPKTIDNDLSGTDYTFGFDTAVTIATEAIDRLHTTAESHNRVMVVEVMGRHNGWIAVWRDRRRRGRDPDPRAADHGRGRARQIRARHARGKDFSIVVVSEGYELTTRPASAARRRRGARIDQFGHVRLGGVGDASRAEIEQLTGFETRVTVLGHVQRGGTPTPRDRVLATRFGAQGRRPGRAKAGSGRWRRCTATRSSTSRSRRRTAELQDRATRAGTRSRARSSDDRSDESRSADRDRPRRHPAAVRPHRLGALTCRRRRSSCGRHRGDHRHRPLTARRPGTGRRGRHRRRRDLRQRRHDLRPRHRLRRRPHAARGADGARARARIARAVSGDHVRVGARAAVRQRARLRGAAHARVVAAPGRRVRALRPAHVVACR